jgi:hypothetical protein
VVLVAVVDWWSPVYHSVQQQWNSVYCSLCLQLLWADDSAAETDETHCESGSPSGVFQEDHVQEHSCSPQSAVSAPESVYQIPIDVYCFISFASHSIQLTSIHQEKYLHNLQIKF